MTAAANTSSTTPVIRSALRSDGIIDDPVAASAPPREVRRRRLSSCSLLHLGHCRAIDSDLRRIDDGLVALDAGAGLGDDHWHGLGARLVAEARVEERAALRGVLLQLRRVHDSVGPDAVHR